MPNHVTTVCSVAGDPETVNRFIQAHIVLIPEKPNQVFFDFGTVVPKPDCVDKTTSGSMADAGFFALTGIHEVKFALEQNPMHYFARHSGFQMTPLTRVDEFLEWLKKKYPEAIREGEAQRLCFRETGHRSWYEWNIANWGTKWGAYEYKERFREPGKFVFEFETAWSIPEPIFEALAERYPELRFELASIDEGGPQYEGVYSDKGRRWERAPDDRERYRLVYGEYPEDEDDSDEELN